MFLTAEKPSVPLNSSDIVVLIILGILFLAGIRIVIGFFKTSKKQREVIAKMKENEAREKGPVTAAEKNEALSARAKESEYVDFENESATATQVQLCVRGMMCGMCESHVKDAIRKAFPQATRVKASHTKGEASFRLQARVEDEVLQKKLREAIGPTGYELLSVQTAIARG